MSWEIIWKIIFIFIMCAFAVMAVFTTFLGARDVKTLLRELNEEEKDED